jgi:hypothetical protein
MKTKQISALTVVLAITLVFANIDSAFAVSEYKGYEKSAIHAIEVKQAKAAAKMVKALQDYKQTLTEHKFDNKATEKRVASNTKSIENKIDGIVNLLKNRPSLASKDSIPPSAEMIGVAKFSGITQGGAEVMRVTYKVTAGSSDLRDAKIFIESDSGQLENRVRNLPAEQSSTHTVFLKVVDQNSVSLKLVY